MQALKGTAESALQRFARTELVKVCLFSVAFFLAYKYTSAFTFKSPAPLWFPDSVLLCTMLLVPRRRWLLYLLISLPIRYALEIEAPTWFLLPAYLNDSLKAVLSAYVLQRISTGSVRLNTLRQVVAFCVVAVVTVPALSALAGASLRVAAGFEFGESWIEWFLGDALAALLITPTLIYWCTIGWREARGHVIELACLAAGGTVCMWYTFIRPHADYSPIVLYAPVPFLIWAATRFGPTCASTTISLLALVSIVSTVEERGPFSATYALHDVTSMQLFLAVVAVPVLFTAILLEERRRVENDLLDSQVALEQNHRQIRDLLGSVIHAREEERSRIARDLHDGLGQALTALKMELAWIGSRLPDDPSGMQTKLIETGTLIDEAIGAVRSIATDLRPAMLDDLGLEAAVEWQSREFQDRTGIDCPLRTTVGDVALDPLISTAVFRIFQESLTNVARHSGAACVSVSLNFVDSDLVLEIHDDGIGISSADMSSHRSIGLAGMRERAHLVGGAVSISSAAGDGTTVLVKIPIRPEAAL